MHDSMEKQSIHMLLQEKQGRELYETHKSVIDLMLGIQTQQEFDDFLEDENSIDEKSFWLYYAVVHNEALAIGGYEQDVTEKVKNFLRVKLPKTEFLQIETYLYEIYVDIDGKDNLKEKIDCCNQCMKHTNYKIAMMYEDRYCAWSYFLFVKSNQR